MKTKEELLKGKYIIESNGKQIVFNNETPKRTAQKIVELYNSKQRVILDYGDIKTGKSWNESHYVTGRVGMSKGFLNLLYPILVYNNRSYGGMSILTHCILSIKTSKGKNLIFKHK